MKHGKRLTLEMKMFLKSIGLNPKNWLYVKNTPEEVHFINVNSSHEKVFKKEGKSLCS
jgi:hypothetical protein